MIILYAENEEHMNILEYIEQNIDNYAYILHDKDFNEKGELKKPHYHVVLRFKNQLTVSALSKKLNLPENYIEFSKKSYIYALRYLIHIDDEDKSQYDFSEVVGTTSMLEILEKSINGDKSESEYILEIINLIDEMGYIKIREFIVIICAKKLYSYYRRSAYTINLIINQHNDEYNKTMNLV